MRTPKLLTAALLGLSIVGALSLSALEQDAVVKKAQPPVVLRQFLGAGTWQSQRDGLDKRDWHVELKRRDDDSLVGRITVLGSPLLDEARIEGRIDGAEVYGVLVGPDDRQIGTFTGTRARKSMSGTYTFGNGDTGTWSWRGAPPE
ncbi:hypothetical protein L6Q96_05795 [Candidatus Binatia bacterium]|nr:hypothetical protein [Candidatus Binatia bacterium]